MVTRVANQNLIKLRELANKLHRNDIEEEIKDEYKTIVEQIRSVVEEEYSLHESMGLSRMPYKSICEKIMSILNNFKTH